MTDYMIKDY